MAKKHQGSPTPPDEIRMEQATRKILAILRPLKPEEKRTVLGAVGIFVGH